MHSVVVHVMTYVVSWRILNKKGHPKGGWLSASYKSYHAALEHLRLCNNSHFPAHLSQVDGLLSPPESLSLELLDVK